jgi:protein involved in polysaccharide export with SLBB domain
LRSDVVSQARPGQQIAFDVVKIDDVVLRTLLAQPKSVFDERFKQYQPPSQLKIAVGDSVSVVIWEAASNGLFGDSLTELSFPAGSVARSLIEQQQPLGGVPATPGGMASSAETLAQLYGQGAAPGSAQSSTAAGAAGATVGTSAAGAAGGVLAAAAVARNLSPDLQRLLDLAMQTGRAGTTIPEQQVGSDGAVSIPFAGRVHVAGRTPDEVARIIEDRLGPKALSPQVLVVDGRSAVNSVTVNGEVVGGRRVPLSLGGDRLLEVIAAAGGAKTPPGDTLVRLSRDGVTATVSLATLVSDPAQNIYAAPGDVLTLERHPKTFTVLGATGKNAAITFDAERLSLAEALGKAGGLLDDRADSRAIFLFRYEPDSVVRALGQPMASKAPVGLSPIAYRLDLHDAKAFLLARQFPVHDSDVIFAADASSHPIFNFFLVLSQITGPIEGAFVTCSNTIHC